MGVAGAWLGGAQGLAGLLAKTRYHGPPNTHLSQGDVSATYKVKNPKKKLSLFTDTHNSIGLPQRQLMERRQGGKALSALGAQYLSEKNAAWKNKKGVGFSHGGMPNKPIL